MSSGVDHAESRAGRPRRVGRWIVAFLCLFVVAVVGSYLYQILDAEHELRAAFAEVERTDPRWRLADVEGDRSSFPPEANSAPVVTKVRRLLPANWPFWESSYAAAGGAALPPGDPDKNKALSDSLENLQPQQPLNDEQTASLRTELTRAAAALGVARQLDRLTEGRHPIAYSSDWVSTRVLHLDDVRQVCRLPALDAMLRVHDGDADGALMSCRAASNAGRSVGDEPLLISQLVRIFCVNIAVRRLERVVAQGEPSEEALRTVQRLLEREGLATPLLTAVRGERAGLDSLLEAVAAGRTKITARDLVNFSYFCGSNAPSLGQEFEVWRPGFLTAQRAAVLCYMNQAAAAASLPAERRHDAFARLEATLPGQPILVRRLVQAWGKTSDACQRCDALRRCAVAAVAAERYRRANGRWPDSLDALTKANYLTEIPADPFDGKPLHWRRLEDGAEAYSVGPDGEDNGGEMDRKDWTAKGTDIGFRLWDVSSRRQPSNAGVPRK